MRKVSRVVSLLMVVSLIMFGAVACSSPTEESTEEKRQEDVDDRWDVFYRAQALWPVPVDQLQNFPLREALVKFVMRQDEVNHPWYIYLRAFDGTPIGYYVGQTYPQSACNFLSSSEYLSGEGATRDAVDNVLQAPSLDGMYYGGGGSSAACLSMFFFDATTDAMITFSAPIWTATDVPDPEFTGRPLGPTAVEDVVPADMDEQEQPVPASPEATQEG